MSPGKITDLHYLLFMNATHRKFHLPHLDVNIINSYTCKNTHTKTWKDVDVCFHHFCMF